MTPVCPVLAALGLTSGHPRVSETIRKPRNHAVRTIRTSYRSALLSVPKNALSGNPRAGRTVPADARHASVLPRVAS